MSQYWFENFRAVPCSGTSYGELIDLERFTTEWYNSEGIVSWDARPNLPLLEVQRAIEWIEKNKVYFVASPLVASGVVSTAFPSAREEESAGLTSAYYVSDAHYQNWAQAGQMSETSVLTFRHPVRGFPIFRDNRHPLYYIGQPYSDVKVQISPFYHDRGKVILIKLLCPTERQFLPDPPPFFPDREGVLLRGTYDISKGSWRYNFPESLYTDRGPGGQYRMFDDSFSKVLYATPYLAAEYANRADIYCFVTRTGSAMTCQIHLIRSEYYIRRIGIVLLLDVLDTLSKQDLAILFDWSTAIWSLFNHRVTDD